MRQSSPWTVLSREEMKQIKGGGITPGTMWKCTGGIEICSIGYPAASCGVSGCVNLRDLCIPNECD